VWTAAMGDCWIQSIVTSSSLFKLLIHCEPKKNQNGLLSVTSPNTNRFSKFFQCLIHQ